MTEPKTICANCKHHRNDTSQMNHEIWYSWFCAHPELEREKGIDPVTGRETYFGKNDLDRVYCTDQKYPYCRDHNHGNCPLHERSTLASKAGKLLRQIT